MRFNRSIFRKLLIAAFMVAATGVQASDDRADTLGQGLICLCSCNQLLSGCEMINCSSRPPLRKELKQLIDEGKDDKTILAMFKDKYGPKVLSAPTTKGWFNLSAWVTPFAALTVGAFFIVVFLKHRKANAPAEAPAPIDTSKYDAEIEEELRKLNPED